MMQKASKIYLIGFMGSGKTTTGKKLASKLGWSYIDLDIQIEKKTGMKIPEIFSIKGESFFRSIESRELHRTSQSDNAVISTGGGTPCFDNNMDFMMENGLTVYLKMSPAQLKKRLENSKGERPLLNNVSSEQLIDFISEKLTEREKYYDRSEVIIDGTHTDLACFYSMIRSMVRE